MSAAEPILSVRGLVTSLAPHLAAAGDHPPVDHVSFDVRQSGVLGLIGESGCGKSLTALSIMRLLPADARQVGGNIFFRGRDLSALSEAQMQAVRGRSIAMIFQEPATALSPVHTIGWQLNTALVALGQLPRRRLFERRRREGRDLASKLLSRVELPDPEHILDAYAHQLSAGMRRRVLIALALAGQPALLIADEPTTGLDAPVQSQIVDLIARLTREGGMSAIVISHDLGAVAEIATDLVVMYAGQVVEAGPASSVFNEPQHPYTLSLYDGARRLEAPRGSAVSDASRGARGADRRSGVANGCRFAGGCPQRRGAPQDFPLCVLEAPALSPLEARHRARCFYPRLEPVEEHE